MRRVDGLIVVGDSYCEGDEEVLIVIMGMNWRQVGLRGDYGEDAWRRRGYVYPKRKESDFEAESSTNVGEMHWHGHGQLGIPDRHFRIHCNAFRNSF